MGSGSGGNVSSFLIRPSASGRIMRIFTRLLLIMFFGGLLGWLFGWWSFTKVLLTIGLVIGLRFIGEGLLIVFGLISLFNLEINDMEVLKARLFTRFPIIGRWLRRKTARELSTFLQEGDKQATALLAEALTSSKDKKVRRIAREALEHLSSQSCIDAVAAMWLETRHLRLTQLLVEHNWMASAPIKAWVYSALKTGQIEPLKGGDGGVVEELLDACGDFDEDISTSAQQVLRQLYREEAKEALCRMVIDHDHPVAVTVALESGYLPRDAAQRALFLFLTEQWERYESLDFDHYLLSTAHRTASPELRQRIAKNLRTAGRTDFLTILVGTDYCSRAADMTSEETEVLIQMLSAQQEWAKLWKLVFELPFIRGIRIVQTLHHNAWQPERGDERVIFGELSALGAHKIVTSEEEARRVLPLALQEATIRVKGRVNDVAFSPVRPVIAIGTGNRKVALWNFQHGEMEQVFEGFDHSIGSVTFLPKGTLICAERTNAVTDPCAIYVCRNNKKIQLGRHEGSVTSIEAVGETELLSTGRDQKVILWNVPKKRKVKEKNMPFWARSATVSADGKHAALLHEGVTLMNIPKLDRVRNWSKGSVGRCAAFVPNDDALIVGKSNGQVLSYKYEDAKQTLPWESQPLKHHDRRTQGVAVLSHNSTIITAGSEGKLHFTDWTARKLLGSVEMPDMSFTSLHISPNGVFMSTGDSEASMSLWDLRVLDVPELFTRPFAQASPDHLVSINELAVNPQLKSNIRTSLSFIQKVLQYRFRFDIEIDEVPTIKVGEFDIEIE